MGRLHDSARIGTFCYIHKLRVEYKAQRLILRQLLTVGTAVCMIIGKDE